MVNEAEEFAEQDKKVKARIDARNQLETYCYNVKQSVGDKLKEKLEAGEVEAVEKAAQGALDWMDENQVRAGGWRGVGAGHSVGAGAAGVACALCTCFCRSFPAASSSTQVTSPRLLPAPPFPPHAAAQGTQPDCGRGPRGGGQRRQAGH